MPDAVQAPKHLQLYNFRLVIDKHRLLLMVPNTWFLLQSVESNFKFKINVKKWMIFKIEKRSLLNIRFKIYKWNSSTFLIRTAANAVEHSNDNSSKMLIIVLDIISAANCNWSSNPMETCEIETPFICYWFSDIYSKKNTIIVTILWKKIISFISRISNKIKYSNKSR